MTRKCPFIISRAGGGTCITSLIIGSISISDSIFQFPWRAFAVQCKKMGGRTVAWLAAAVAVATVLECADAKITVEDSFYRYDRMCPCNIELSNHEAEFPV